MDSHGQQSPESQVFFLIIASCRQAFSSIIIGRGFQILDCCGLCALVSWKSPQSLSSPIRNSLTMSERCHACNGHSSIQRSFSCTRLMTPGEISDKICRLVATDPCLADPPENLLSLLKSLIPMTHTKTVTLPQSHWEVYLLLTFLRRRGAVLIFLGAPIHP